MFSSVIYSASFILKYTSTNFSSLKTLTFLRVKATFPTPLCLHLKKKTTFFNRKKKTLFSVHLMFYYD